MWKCEVLSLLFDLFYPLFSELSVMFMLIKGFLEKSKIVHICRKCQPTVCYLKKC